MGYPGTSRISLVDSLYLIAPGRGDAKTLTAQLASAGWRCKNVTPPELLLGIRNSTLGTAILTAAALEILDRDELRDALAAQPLWSDCPLILLSSRGYVPLTSRRAIEGFGNVTVLERPLHPSTLITAVATALRTRARQRRTEAYLHQREEAEANFRSLAGTLEARVVARTIELTDALTERRAAEERLRLSEERYRLTVELSSQTPWVASPDLEILSFGKALADPSTPSPERDFRGMNWLTFIHPVDRAPTLELWHDAKATNRPIDCTFRMILADGNYAWHRARANPKLDGSRTVERWYGTIENIDSQRRGEERFQQLQSELIHVSRVSAMGTMASTLAHELNQPLSAVANYVRGSQRLVEALELPETEAISSALEEADRSVLRASEIVRRLREMVMLKPVDRSVENASSVVSEASQLALIDAGSLGITVDLDPGDGTSRVLVDRVQIQQVLINLYRNAVEAVRSSENRKVWTVIQVVDNFCQITVRDSGPGIDPAVAAKLFTPFNSTKADGMGIGLSISRTIVEAHGGQINGGNSAIGGAEFIVRLPLA